MQVYIDLCVYTCRMPITPCRRRDTVPKWLKVVLVIVVAFENVYCEPYFKGLQLIINLRYWTCHYTMRIISTVIPNWRRLKFLRTTKTITGTLNTYPITDTETIHSNEFPSKSTLPLQPETHTHIGEHPHTPILTILRFDVIENGGNGACGLRPPLAALWLWFILGINQSQLVSTGRPL